MRHRTRRFLYTLLRALRSVAVCWYGFIPLLGVAYLSTLLRTPHVLLWNLAAAVFLLAAAAALRWPRIIPWWLPPCILLFNTPGYWLPWPYVKVVYLAPVAACVVLWLLSPRRVRQRAGLHPLVVVLLICAGCSVSFGVASRLLWEEPATWEEFRRALRMVPVLEDQDLFVGLRYGYVWLVGLATYTLAAAVITTPRDVNRFIMSLHLTALPIAAFAVYSYLTNTYMVQYYVFERRVNATCSSPAVLADVLTVIAVLGLRQLLRAQRWYHGVLFCFFVAAELLIILLTGCRVNVVVLAGIILVGGTLWLVHAGIRHPRTAVRGIVLVSLMVAIGASMIVWQWPLVRQLPIVKRLDDWHRGIRTRQFRSMVFPGRIDHWDCALRMLKAAPLWGLGAGSFEANYRFFRSSQDLFEYARAHNVYLRAGAEGGIVILITFGLTLGWAAWRISRFWRSAYDAAASEWAWYGRSISLGLLCIALTALTSDVALENVEMVVFWAMLAGVVRACLWHTETKVTMVPGRWHERWAHAERHFQRWCARQGWERVGRLRLRTVGFAGILLFIISLCIPGLRAAQARARQYLRSSKTYYGFSYLERTQPGNIRWYTISHAALAALPKPHPLLLLRYRALNERMARYGQLLSVYINGVFIASVRLTSVQEQLLYCDLTGVQNQPLLITLRTQRVWVPWREGWGARYQPCGAVVSYPQLLALEPSNIYGTVTALWSTNLSAYPTFYLARDAFPLVY